MVGVAIHNEVKQNDRPIGISFRRNDQLNGNKIWSVWKSTARFNAVDTLIGAVHAVRMYVGLGRVKTKSRPLSVMAHLKRSIIKVSAEMNCLAHLDDSVRKTKRFELRSVP
jgi:hypothetical protein